MIVEEKIKTILGYIEHGRWTSEEGTKELVAYFNKQSKTVHKSREAFVDYLSGLELQNLSGREDFREAFDLGIGVAYDELTGKTAIDTSRIVEAILKITNESHYGRLDMDSSEASEIEKILIQSKTAPVEDECNHPFGCISRDVITEITHCRKCDKDIA